ncbi:hypothetical protein PO124_34455 [Bacillus licheniformis]|nr:hypothetical protein [Bacillus licheniformis]
MKNGNVQSTSPEAIVEADGLAVIKEGKLVNWLEGKRREAFYGCAINQQNVFDNSNES